MPKLNILEVVAVGTPKPYRLWCGATWRVCSRKAFVALACNFCFILFLILSLWRKYFARHSPTVILPILLYLCNLRSSGTLLSFLDNLKISRIQVIGGKFSFVWCCSLVAFDTSTYVNQNPKITLTAADMLANAGQKDHIVVAVLAVYFLLSTVSSWRHSLTLMAGTGLCWAWRHEVQMFFGSEPFQTTMLSTVAPQVEDARSERKEVFIAVPLLWKAVRLNWGQPQAVSPVGQNGKPEALVSNTYIGNNVLCPAVRTWYLTTCSKPQLREESSAFSLDNMFRCLNFMIMNAIIKSTRKTVVAFSKRERLYRLILHFSTKSTLLLYNLCLHAPEGL